MATNYPNSLDDDTSLPNPGSNSFTNNPSHAGQHDTENDAIKALETKLGTGASTATASTVLRGTGSGTTAYGQLVLTTDVTGVLPASNGGTGISSLGTGIATFLGTPTSANLASAITDETGTGALVFANSPTVVTPTIASFVNANHNHTNAAGGGILNLFGTIAIQKFTASGTYTPNPKMIYCVIECWGAGGGGGNVLAASNYNLYASGGGSGGYSKLTATAATIGASKAVTIGAGGAGNSAASTTTANNVFGGDTSVGTICIAKGGSNGGYAQGGVQVSGVGIGGSTTGAVGDITAAGINGLAGFYSGVVGQDLQTVAGSGGSTMLGGAGAGAVDASGASAVANTGSGGAGGSQYHTTNANRAGGTGGSGLVIITEYCTL